jgi:hypothetical protein
MANQALIQGAAAAAPKFVDYGSAISDSFNKVYQEGAKLAQERKDALLELEEQKADAFKNMSSVDTKGLTSDIAEAVQGRALEIRDQYYDLIQKKNELGPLKYEMEAKKLEDEIAEINGLVVAQKQFGSDSREAIEIGLAPYGDQENADAVRSLVDTKISKTISRDEKGNLVWKTQDGKTINPYSLKPLETTDYKVGVQYEQALKTALKTNSLNQNSLTPSVIKEQTELQLSQLNPSQLKSLAVHYGLGGDQASSWFKGKTNEEIKEAVVNSAVQRISTFASDLNKSKTPKQTATTGSNFTATLRQELQTRYGEASKYASIANTLQGKKEGSSVESKMKFILKEMKAMNPDIDLITRGDAYNSFYKNRKAEWDNASKSERKEKGYLDPYNEKNKKTFRTAFKDKYGTAQFFNSKDLRPRNDVDTTDSIGLFNFMMGQADMTDEAKAVFRDQFMPGLVGEKREKEKTKGQGFNYQPGSNIDPNNVRVETTYNGITI